MPEPVDPDDTEATFDYFHDSWRITEATAEIGAAAADRRWRPVQTDWEDLIGGRPSSSGKSPAQPEEHTGDVPPAGFEPATPGLGVRRSIP